MDHSNHHNHSGHHDHKMMTTTATTTTQLPLHDHSGHHNHMDHSMHHGMDHSMNHGMDHSMNHGMDHSNHHSMKMWFHGGTNEVILFDFWTINSLSGLLFSCFIIFFSAACYEGLKWFRVYLQTEASKGKLLKIFNKKSFEKNKRNATTIDGDKSIPLNTPCCGNNECPENQSPATKGCSSRNVKDSPCLRIVLALLYVLQLSLAYCLMLITMTYNIYLGTAVVFGAGLGNYLFSGIDCSKDEDQILSYAEDACH